MCDYYILLQAFFRRQIIFSLIMKKNKEDIMNRRLIRPPSIMENQAQISQNKLYSRMHFLQSIDYQMKSSPEMSWDRKYFFLPVFIIITLLKVEIIKINFAEQRILYSANGSNYAVKCKTFITNPQRNLYHSQCRGGKILPHSSLTSKTPTLGQPKQRPKIRALESMCSFSSGFSDGAA